jgi:L-amino acid N-acyltransferase YncA
MLERHRIDSEEIRKGLAPWLLTEIERFESLGFNAGLGAVNWLRAHIENPDGPFEVVFTVNKGKLLGFCALAYKRICLPPDHEFRSAMELSWIARSETTEKGFGRELLTYAATLAMAAGIEALLVSPNDHVTARKVWINKHDFEPVDGEPPRPGHVGQVFFPIPQPSSSA